MCPGAKVLVVDDNATNRRLVEMQLKRFGRKSIAVESGEAAIKIFEGNGGEVCVILLDCHMPGLSGFETARRLRASGVKIPIIGISASTEAQDRDDAILAGMNAFVSRPMNMADLKRALDAQSALDV
jgi:CheY-like chemotaxis protein